ncbi:MAG: hypothetical protein AB7E98_11945 [Pirellulales bacterium]
MVREIKIGASLQCTKGSFVVPKMGSQIVQATMNGLGGGAPGIVTIGPADEVISFAEIENPGWLWMRNIDGNQTVIWGPDNAGSMVPMGRMKPGDPAVFRIDPATVLRMQVDPASEEGGSTSAENQAKVHIVVLED